MSLAKELTSHSLPEIGDAFGGRDHTTVLHACKKISEISLTDNKIKEDLINLKESFKHIKIHCDKPVYNCLTTWDMFKIKKTIT